MKTHLNLFRNIGLCLFILFMSYSCQKNISLKPGGHTALNVFLTDDPSLVFDKVSVEVVKLEVKTEDDGAGDDSGHHSGGDDSGNDDSGSDNEGSGSSHDDDAQATDDHGGWIELDIHPGIYNLLDLRNGVDTLLATGDFPSAQSLKKVRLTLGTNNQVVYNGVAYPLMVKDESNIVIVNLESSAMNLSGSGKLDFWLDFDAGRSIRQEGNGFELQSRIKAFSRDKAGSIEGRIMPVAAKAIVYAINGTDTSSAKPGNEGEFKLVGLKPGIYSLLIDATAGNYKDQTISGIAVSKGEDTHIETITLQP